MGADVFFCVGFADAFFIWRKFMCTNDYSKPLFVFTSEVNEGGKIFFRSDVQEIFWSIGKEFFYLLTEDGIELITNKFKRDVSEAMAQFSEDNIEACYIKIDNNITITEKTMKYLNIAVGDIVLISIFQDGAIIEKYYGN